MARSIRIERNIEMKMRDGVTLRADFYGPDDREKHPVILIRTPYNKLLSHNSDFLNPIDTAYAGCVIIVQDIRGRFASEGEWAQGVFRYYQEEQDGYDTIEWLASQPWCDGNVGMAGGSYLAMLQWLAAASQPPHLKAIAPWIGAGSPGAELQLTGGAFSLYLSANWIPLMGVDVADRLEKQGKDVREMRRMIARAMFYPEEVYHYLPLKDTPHFKFERIDMMWQGALRPPLDAQLLERFRRPYDKITVPCFHCAGWYDVYVWSTFENYRQMKQQGGSSPARGGQHVLMGPWIHGARLLGFWGDLNFGPSAGVPGNLATEHNLAFFDKYLRGRDINIPAVRYFLMGANRWKTADDWPLPQTQWQRFYLHSQGAANTAGGNGWISQDEPGREPPDRYIYDPLNPVPTVGGRCLPITGLVPGPIDQQHLEKRHDVLCYTSAALNDELEITGPLAVHLFAATSVKDTDFTAKLINVFPDGRAYNVAEGIIRARGRKSLFQPEFVNPGEINEYVINLGGTSQLFRKGHRIRIDIASSDFPKFDRNMNTGNPTGEDTTGIPAMQTVFHQTGYASYIDLPVIPQEEAPEVRLATSLQGV